MKSSLLLFFFSVNGVKESRRQDKGNVMVNSKREREQESVLSDNVKRRRNERRKSLRAIVACGLFLYLLVRIHCLIATLSWLYMCECLCLADEKTGHLFACLFALDCFTFLTFMFFLFFK